MKTRTKLYAAALAAACAACGDYAAINYRLERAGQSPLPILLSDSAGCRYSLRGGDITFSGNRRYTSTFDIDVACADGPNPPAPQLGTAGRVRIRRDTAFFSDSLGNQNGFGILTDDSLVVQGAVYRLLYRRTPDR